MDAFTLFHVALSLAGIAAGFVVLRGMVAADPMPRATALFLATTAATSLTGFAFPYHGPTPAIAVGILSMAVLGAAAAGRYAFGLAGAWRPVYVTGAVIALYLNVFVLVAQAFAKIPSLTMLAPTQSEPPFEVAQGLVLAFFVVMGLRSLRRFRPAVRAG